MNTQDLATLIADTRGGTTENLHLGVIAHVNAQGQLQTQAGAAQWPVFTRSALKPFQALPFVSGGAPRTLALALGKRPCCAPATTVRLSTPSWRATCCAKRA